MEFVEAAKALRLKSERLALARALLTRFQGTEDLPYNRNADDNKAIKEYLEGQVDRLATTVFALKSDLKQSQNAESVRAEAIKERQELLLKLESDLNKLLNGETVDGVTLGAKDSPILRSFQLLHHGGKADRLQYGVSREDYTEHLLHKVIALRQRILDAIPSPEHRSGYGVEGKTFHAFVGQPD